MKLSEKPIHLVLLLLLLQIKRLLCAEMQEQQQEPIPVRSANNLTVFLSGGSKNGTKVDRVKTVFKAPKYDPPPNEVYRQGETWLLLDSPLNQIPIPLAPTPTVGEVVPKPRRWHRDRTFYVFQPDVVVCIEGPSNYILEKAVDRYSRLMQSCRRLSIHPRTALSTWEGEEELSRMARKHARNVEPQIPPSWSPNSGVLKEWKILAKESPSTSCAPAGNRDAGVGVVRLRVKRLGNAWPSAEMNESYSLMVIGSEVRILANEVWGALRALETLSQLLWCPPSGSMMFINRTFIEDSPSFPYRGLHLDTSRHFISKRNILINLEAMAFNKLNVFHWHLTDDQSFPYLSKTFPEFAKKAAFHPQMVYTPEDIREVIEFARVRGIRVIPEFDIPGHTRSWSLVHPEIFAKCYSMEEESPFYGGLDTSKTETLDLLTKYFEEIIELFPEAWLHMGFDEVEFSCWDSNPGIQNRLVDSNFDSSLDLFKDFTTKLLNRIQTTAKSKAMGGKRNFIFWQEAFDNGLKVPNDSVIHFWKTMSSIPGSLGYKSIMSKGWYLDHYARPSEWVSYYENEIIPSALYVDAYKDFDPKSVLGGEACMWNEWQSDETVIQRIWPVMVAIAERLWNYASPNADEFGPRLEEQRCRLLRRGVPVGVASGPGECPFPTELGDIFALRHAPSVDPDLQPADRTLADCSDVNSGLLLLVVYGLVFFLLGHLTGRFVRGNRVPRVITPLSVKWLRGLPVHWFWRRLAVVLLTSFLLLTAFCYAVFSPMQNYAGLRGFKPITARLT